MGQDQRLTDLGLPADSSLAAVERSLRGIEEQLNALAVMHVRGEELALALTTAAESAQRTELSEQLVVAQRLVDERRSDLTQHERTGETATSILEATRTAARLAVDERVQQIEPLVERIYARMDPHPVFTKVRLATSYTGGRGHIRPLVEDPSAGLTDRDPYTLFSSSQLNALAVSLFLGLNLGTHGASLRTVMLDDPLQSLDDVNLLGLIDTLRRTKAHRQLLISTHDPRLTQLVRRKLRPVGNDQRTRVYSFSDWDETGPKVAEEEVQAEPAEFRMAAA